MSPSRKALLSLRFKVFLPLLVLGALGQAWLVLAWLPENVRSEREQHGEISGSGHGTLSGMVVIRPRMTALGPRPRRSV